MKKYNAKLLLIIFSFCFGSNILFSQGEANNWYFGNNAGITFNNGIPEALTDGVLNTNEGCATISDASGQLLFYTDGVVVYNRNHNIMPNGTGLLGDTSSTQSSIIVPKPNDPNIYYVFTVDKTGDPDGLRYSVVDMTLDNGFGAITTTKNILLFTPVSEKINAILHANGQDIWVLTHGYGNNEFYAYLVTSTGINTTPITSATGIIVQNNTFDTIGVLKASPNGNKLVMCARDSATQVFDFNNATGVVSNPIDVYLGLSSYGAEFSPSGNLLYVTHWIDREGLWQYDLTATDIPNSGQLIFEIPDSTPNQELGQLQLGSDNKIYLSIRFRDYLSVINNPENLGIACNFNSNAVFLEGNLCEYGLPTFIQSYFHVGFQYEDVCLGNATPFTANISQAYDTLLWDFGEGNTSTVENPTHTYTSTGSYTVTFTVTSGTQTSTDIKTVTVFDVPIVTPTVQLAQCDDNLDGFSVFNLTEVNAELSANYQNESITFYETQTDAENATNSIVNETIYVNQTVSTDVVWARIENNHGCYSTAQVDLVVSTTQIPDTYTRDFYQCDDGADTTDGIATFDFSLVNSEIQALFPVGQQLIINYYLNQVDALSETNPIADISNYQNIGYPNQHQVFVRVDSALDNDCLGLGTHITLHVEKVPVAHPVTIEEQCDDDGDGMYNFDTSNIETTLLNGQTNATVEYFDALGNPLPSPLPNPFLSASQTITARVINANSQDPDGACYDETQIVFSVDAAAVAHQVQDFIACDDDNDEQFDFDTSSIETTVLNGQTGMVVSYTDENGNALPSPLPNPFTTSTQTITVRVENSLSSICYDETTINFVVNEQPVANPITNDFVCDDISNDGEHIFTLSDYNSQILDGQSQTTFEVFYYDTNADAQSNTNALSNSYMVSSTSQTVFARIQNSSNPNCFDITSFELGVHYLPIANQPQDLLVCDDVANNGIETVDLSSLNTEILNGQSATENTISYHLTQSDAETNTNVVDSNFTNTENPQTIYVRLENSNYPECYTTTSFQVVVNEQPVLLMDNLWSICEDDTVEIIADSGYDEYLWSTGETTQTIIVDASGTYEVTVTNVYGDLSCSVSKTLTVTNSNIATITNIETVDWTQNNNVVTVFVEGYGDYEYSLDGINYQDSNEFTNLTIDDYIVYVRDKNGCGIATEDIYLLYYPKFFTPNGDGYNEVWQLYNSDREPNNKIYIFDRYGKLLKQLRPTDYGWDGTFKGNSLPTNDYWFVLERQNGKTYKGHFTLKR